MEVSNTTASAMHITLYPAAAAITDGSFVGGAGHAVSALTTWTAVDSAGADVAAGAKAMSTVTINVPPDAAPGEQYGVIWAETSSAAPAGGGVTQVSRVGIRLYVDVGPGNPPAADFAVDTLTAQRAADGAPAVVASVHNTGGRAVDMSGTLGLSAGPGGLSAGLFPAQLGTTLTPGQTEPVTVKLDKGIARRPVGRQDHAAQRAGGAQRPSHDHFLGPRRRRPGEDQGRATGLAAARGHRARRTAPAGRPASVAARRRRRRQATAVPPQSPPSPAPGVPTQPTDPSVSTPVDIHTAGTATVPHRHGRR